MFFFSHPAILNVRQTSTAVGRAARNKWLSTVRSAPFKHRFLERAHII